MAKLFASRINLDNLPNPTLPKQNIYQGGPTTPIPPKQQVITSPDINKGTTNTGRYIDAVSLGNRFRQHKLGSTVGLPEYIFSDVNTGYIKINKPKDIPKQSTIQIKKVDGDNTVLRQGGILTQYNELLSITKPNTKFSLNQYLTIPNTKVVKLVGDELITNPETKINKIVPGDRITDPKIKITKVKAGDRITNPNIKIIQIKAGDRITDPKIKIVPVKADELIVNPNITIQPITADELITNPNTQIIKIVPGDRITDPKIVVVPVKPDELITNPNIKVVLVNPDELITIPNTIIKNLSPDELITNPDIKIKNLSPDELITDPKTPIQPLVQDQLIIDPKTVIKPIAPGSRTIIPNVLIIPTNPDELIEDPGVEASWEFSNEYLNSSPDTIADRLEADQGTGNPEFDGRPKNKYSEKNAYSTQTPRQSDLSKRGENLQYFIEANSGWVSTFGDPNQPGGFKTLNYDQIQRRASDSSKLKTDFVVELGLNKTPPIENYEQRLGMPANKADTINKSVTATATDLVKVFLSSPRDGIGLQFRAYVTAFSDNYTTNYADVNYVGRPETLKIYKGATRNINLGFKVPLFSEEELPIVYQKLEKLVHTGIMGKVAQSTYMTGPFLQLTVGGWLHKTPVIINTLKYDTVPLDYSWDISKEVPQVIDVTMDFIALSDNTGTGMTNTGNYIRAGLA